MFILRCICQTLLWRCVFYYCHFYNRERSIYSYIAF